MTLGINALLDSLNNWRPFKDDLDAYFTQHADHLQKPMDEAVQAGLFNRWEGAPTRFSFTPLGKRVRGLYLLHKESTT